MEQKLGSTRLPGGTTIAYATAGKRSAEGHVERIRIRLSACSRGGCGLISRPVRRSWVWPARVTDAT